MAHPVKQSVSAEGTDLLIDPGHWRNLAVSQDPEQFFESWLEVQVKLLPEVSRALVLHYEADRDEFVIAATWPNENVQQADLIDAAGEVIAEGQPTVSEATEAPDELIVAYPLKVGGGIQSISLFALPSRSEQELKNAMSRVQWGSSWLEVLYLRRQNQDSDSTLDKLRTMMDLVAATAEHRGYEAALSAMVTEMASRMGCERVSFAEYRARKNRVKALSHSGQFGQQMNLINSIGRAMDEATDQRQTIAYPPLEDQADNVTRFHGELAQQHGSNVIVSAPLFHRDRPMGALCFEYPNNKQLTESDVDLCDAFAVLLAPILADKRSLNRNILVKNLLAFRDFFGFLLGPKYLFLKLFFAALIAGGVYLYNATAAYNITADAVLEGAVQRVVAAPFDGYIAASFRRAGDRVSSEELLGELDDRDLKLELIELSSERAQAASQHREAQAARERARTKIFKARMDQTDARIELVKEQIERTRLKAPFDGIVVSGDLSQSLGAAVERGEVLFEVAPLDDYRVILEVDERDIDYIDLGQSVSLVLSALPDEKIVTEVNKITPVSTAAEGRNFFRVEAHYQATHARLRPGMAGIAKVSIDERPLLWIWTRELVDWVRLWIWRWFI